MLPSTMKRSMLWRHEAVDVVAATMSERVGDCMMALLAELGD